MSGGRRRNVKVRRPGQVPVGPAVPIWGTDEWASDQPYPPRDVHGLPILVDVPLDPYPSPGFEVTMPLVGQQEVWRAVPTDRYTFPQERYTPLRYMDTKDYWGPKLERSLPPADNHAWYGRLDKVSGTHFQNNGELSAPRLSAKRAYNAARLIEKKYVEGRDREDKRKVLSQLMSSDPLYRSLGKPIARAAGLQERSIGLFGMMHEDGAGNRKVLQRRAAKPRKRVKK